MSKSLTLHFPLPHLLFLTAAVVCLKLVGVVNLSWWIVLAPLWAPAAFLLSLVFMVFFLMAFAALFLVP